MSDIRHQRFGQRQEIVRDEKWIKHLRSERCLFTGQYGTDQDSIDPLHVGTLGKSVKSPDDEILPIAHHLHLLGHQKGEMSMIREHAPDDVLRLAFRALAREMYAAWKSDQSVI